MNTETIQKDIKILNQYPVTNKLNWRNVDGGYYCFFYVRENNPDSEFFIRRSNKEFSHYLEKPRTIRGRSGLEGIGIYYNL